MTTSEITETNLKYTLFGWSPQKGLNPLAIKSANGVYLYDHEGKRYLDFASQFMTVNIGHGNPKIKEAIIKQMEEVSFIYGGAITEVRGELGKKIAKIAPGNLNKTFFTVGGAEAIENAIKLARIYTGKHKIISQYRSYHGASYGAMSVSGDPRRFSMDSQQIPNIIRVENPYFYRCPFYSKTLEECEDRCIEHIEKVIIYENPDNIAALLLEGESGYSGCIKYPPGYWKKLRNLADKYGILIIDDEVMSGFGRTGKWFAVDHHDVIPDIMCISKGMTSGYLPMGGVIVNEEIAKYFDDRPLPLGLTFTAHPLCCAAALATINVMEDDDLITNAAKMGHYMDIKMQELIIKHPSIGDYRNTGLLGCIELVKSRETKEPIAPFNAKPAELKIQSLMDTHLKKLGIMTFIRWNWIFLAPPLCITKEQIDDGLEGISQTISIVDDHYYNS